MKRICSLLICAVILFGIVVLIAAGCGGDGNSPSSVLKEFTYAQADKDCQRVVAQLDSSSKEILGQAIGPGADPVEGCEQTMQAQTQTIEITDIKILEENINGDTATVRFSITGSVDDQSMSQENTANMVRENGEWKVKLFTATGQQ